MKSITIGLIIKAPVGDAPEANRFYAPVMAGIEELCRVRDIDLLFAAMPVDDDYHPLEVPRLVTDRATDGLIIIGAHLSRGTASALVDWPPSILVDAYAEDASADSIVSDNVGGARTAVEHLIALGHRDIAIVGARPDSFPSVVQRRRGYEQAMAEAELQPRAVEVAHVPPEAAGAAALDYIRANPDVSAIFAANDAVAVETVLAAQRAGLSVPRDVSVVGYDDIDLARFITPAADDDGGRQARDGSACPDAAAPPARVPRRCARPGGRADVARRARLGRPADRRGSTTGQCRGRRRLRAAVSSIPGRVSPEPRRGSRSGARARCR